MATRTNAEILKSRLEDIMNLYWEDTRDLREGIEIYKKIIGYISSFIFSYNKTIKMIKDLEDLLFESDCKEGIDLTSRITKDLKKLKKREKESWQEMEDFEEDKEVTEVRLGRVESRIIFTKFIEKKYEKEFEYSKCINYKD